MGGGTSASPRMPPARLHPPRDESLQRLGLRHTSRRSRAAALRGGGVRGVRGGVQQHAERLVGAALRGDEVRGGGGCEADREQGGGGVDEHDGVRLVPEGLVAHEIAREDLKGVALPRPYEEPQRREAEGGGGPPLVALLVALGVAPGSNDVRLDRPEQPAEPSEPGDHERPLEQRASEEDAAALVHEGGVVPKVQLGLNVHDQLR